MFHKSCENWFKIHENRYIKKADTLIKRTHPSVIKKSVEPYSSQPIVLKYITGDFAQKYI